MFVCMEFKLTTWIVTEASEVTILSMANPGHIQSINQSINQPIDESTRRPLVCTLIREHCCVPCPQHTPHRPTIRTVLLSVLCCGNRTPPSLPPHKLQLQRVLCSKMEGVFKIVTVRVSDTVRESVCV